MKNTYITPKNRVAELDTACLLAESNIDELELIEEEMYEDTEQLGRTKLPTIWDSEW